MKNAILSILVVFAFISVSTFGFPSRLGKCLDDCLSEFDVCDHNCGRGGIHCGYCDNKLTLRINKCVKENSRK